MFPLALLNGCAESPSEKHRFSSLERISTLREFQRTVDVNRLEQLSPKSEPSQAERDVLADQKEVFLRVDEWRDRKLNRQCINSLLPLLSRQLQVSGKRDIHLIGTYKRLRKSYEGLSEISQAEKYGQLTCDLSDLYFGDNSPDSVNHRIDLCKILVKQGKDKEAESMLIKLQRMLETKAVSCSSEPAVLLRLGELYIDQGRFKEAGDRLKLASMKSRQRLQELAYSPTQEQIDNRLRKCKQLMSGVRNNERETDD